MIFQKFFVSTSVLAVILSMSLSGVTLPQKVAYADTAFTVDDNGDGGDSNPGNGLCDDGSGSCTLRAAAEEANALAGTDTINFNGMTVTATADIFLKGNVTLIGSGIIDFNNTGLLYVTDGAGPPGPVDNVVIDGITIQNANNSCLYFITDDADEGGNSLTVENVTISGCQSYGIEGSGTNILFFQNNISDFAANESGIQLAGGSGYEIDGNVIDNTAQNGANTSVGISIAGVVSGVTVTNNDISNVKIGIYTSGDSSDITIGGAVAEDGNNISTREELMSGFGIQVESTDTAIQNNDLISAQGVGALGGGIYVNSVIDHPIQSNTVTNYGAFGISVEDNTVTIGGESAELGNVLTGCSKGISVSGNSGNTIQYNTIDGDGIAGTGMEFSAVSDSIIDHNVVDGYSVDGSTGISFIDGSTGNTVSESVLTGNESVYQAETGDEDINYLEDVSFEQSLEGVGMTVDTGIIDVSFKVRSHVTADNTQTNVSGAVVIVTDADDLETSLGATDVNGVTSYSDYLSAYQVDSTGKINVKTPYTVSVTHETYGELSSSFDTYTSTVNGLEVSFDYASTFEASLTPIAMDAVNYLYRLIYVCSLTGQGQQITMDNTSVGCADGIEGFDWATVDITGGDYAGEKWSLVLRTDVFTAMADIGTWLDQYSGVGADNYNVTNEFLDDVDPDDNIAANGADNDYSFDLPEGGSVVAGFTDPGTLAVVEIDYYASYSPLKVRVGGEYVNYDDMFAYEGVAGESVVDGDGDLVNITGETQGFEWAAVTYTLVGDLTATHSTFLMSRDVYADLDAVDAWLQAMVDAGTIQDDYSIDFYSGPGGDLSFDTPLVYLNEEGSDFTFFWWPENILEEYRIGFTDGATYPAYLSAIENPPTVSLSAVDVTSISENGESVTFTFSLAEGEETDRDIEVFMGWDEDSFPICTDGDCVGDRARLTEGDLIIPEGETSTNYTIATINNSDDEENLIEQFYASGAVNAKADASQTVTVTIVDDDRGNVSGYSVIEEEDVPAEEDIEDDVVEEDVGDEEEQGEEENIPEGGVEVEDDIDGATDTVIGTIADILKEKKDSSVPDIVDAISYYESEYHAGPDEGSELVPEVFPVDGGEGILNVLDGDELVDEQLQAVEEKINEVYESYFGQDVRVIFVYLYSKSEIAKMAEEAQKGGKTLLVLGEKSDYDNDGIPDVLNIAYGYPMFNEDADSDGLTNADELFLDTNPYEKDVDFDLPRVTNVDGFMVGAMPSFRVAGLVGDEVELFLIPADSYDGGNDDFVEQMSLGKTVIDEGHKGEITARYAIPNGVYYVIVNGQNGFGEAAKFTVDASIDKDLTKPEFVEIDTLQGQSTSVLEIGLFVKISLNAFSEATDGEFDTKKYIASKASQLEDIQIIRGKTVPNKRVFITMRSVVFSSVVISDAKGNFEVKIAKNKLDLHNEEHFLTAYATSWEGQMSSALGMRLIKSVPVK